MSLEQLVSALEAEARAEADALLEEARREAARIRGEAEEEAGRRRAELLEARASGWREEAAAEVAEARRAGREVVLRARERLLAGIRRRALDGLGREETTAAYREGLPRHLEAVLRPLAGRSAVVTCPPSLESDVRAALEDRLAGGGAERSGAASAAPDGVEVRPEGDAPPGISARSGDGRLVVDGTLPERLARLWPEIAVEVAAEAARRADAGIP